VNRAPLLRVAAPISGWNLVSRLTGFGRVLVLGGAVGTTFAGNTYQSANLVSNLLFELLAAGLLSSVLVPAFVVHLDPGRRAEAERLAGAVLGMALVVLTPVVVAGVVAGPWLMRGLTATVADAGIRAEEVRLGTFFIWFFLPQVLLYAVGAVATGLLHADGRFAAAAAAPVANNVAVILTLAAFWAMRGGSAPGLDLPLGQRLVLAVGTTGGVLAMAVVPVMAARRAGLRLRPRWEPDHPDLRRLWRQGAWAAAYLALSQVLIATTLVLANRVEGGVVAYQIAFTFFLLPHALLAHPVSTALYPRLAAAGDAGTFVARLGDGLRLITVLVLPASIVLALAARPLLDVVAVGALAGAGTGLVARVVTAYAVGLLGYSGLHFLTRAAYALGDARSPTLVNLGVAAGGSLLMVLWWAGAQGGDRVVVLGWAHSVVVVAGAAALLVVVRRRAGRPLPAARPQPTGAA
jgi:putative peptidoglycan lipid II flippase